MPLSIWCAPRQVDNGILPWDRYLRNGQLETNYYNLAVIFGFSIYSGGVSRFFSKTFSEMAHLTKTHGSGNIPDRLICLFQKLRGF